ncbi:helix-turn-helix transcriptional regulator [Cryobacterium lactosi]|uniref:Helix-turn-helix transcriptional regulator n=1 Tax=Cryobacterium lactosi TaxID=1259202 RepID=A0A4R9BXB4_9MICO|nr:LuxR C-terminal-related transcriptional regulator [Cryobacterium lactosi]TFD93462.1 helix-turn-helix transcriptional regulator [Cryobacterium lactosi]
MALPVLTTKLFVPAVRPHAVSRPRLIEKLRDGRRAGRKLTLVSAPAGFGKTSVLSEWMADARRRDPLLRVAWISLDAADNDPARFLGYLISALQAADPALELGAVTGQPGSDEQTLTALINALAASTTPIILVLDDFQTIEAQPVRDAVSFLLDHQPPTLHLALASRSDPLLPVARLRAGGQLTELRAADLRFTPAEAAGFLTEIMGLNLSATDVAVLDARTEGWIAGLQLAALSLRERDDVSGFIAGFAGSNRFVLDYLVEEVLQRQPAPVRDFLLRTSVLDGLNGALCDAVTGLTGSSEMLAALERDNLFVVPLDDRRQWYRYHHLFADVLRARLTGQDPGLHVLHTRASEWYERNDLIEDAVRHALAADDVERAARLIELAVPSVRLSRHDATLLRWLALLPPPVIRRRPVLGVYRAWSSLVAGDVEAVEPRLAAAESALAARDETGRPAHDSAPSEELRTLPVTIAVYRAAVAQARGDLAGMRTHAQRALDLTEPGDHLGRGAAAGFLGLAAWATGDLDAGVRAFGEVRASLRRAGNLADALSTTIPTADMLLGQGRLRDAQRSYEDALGEALRLSAAEGTPPQSTGDLEVGLSDILREQNDLPAALAHLAASEALGEQAHSHENRYRWFVSMAHIRQAQGDPEAALELLGTAERHYRRGFLPELRPIHAQTARVWISQGRLGEATAWARARGLSSSDAPTYLREFEHLTLARLLIAGHRADPGVGRHRQALHLLGRLLATAETGRRWGSVTEIQLLQALAHAANGDTVRALEPLETALRRAEPEGYCRLFLDEGEPMAALLRHAAAAGIAPDAVRRLSGTLAPGGLQAGGSEAPVGGLADPLSERERHVLRLLASELSGPDIARELYISLNTLRTHTRHIFGKLDVNSRPAAVRRAEALGLV